IENELQVLQSRKFSLEVAERVMKQDSGSRKSHPILWGVDENGDPKKLSQEKIASKLEKRVSFQKLEEKADVVGVSFTSSSPEEAASVVNAVMETYIETSTQQSRKAARATTDFLASEREKLQKKLRNSEQGLRQYMDSTGIVNVDQQSTGMVAQKSETEAELRRIGLELKAIKENITNYEKQLDRIKPGLSEQFSEAIGPRMQSSQQMLARLEQERSLIIAKNPGVLERKPLPARVQYLNREIARLDDKIKGMSKKLFTSNDEFMGMNSEARAQLVSTIQSRLVDLRMQKNQLESRQN